MTTVPLLVTEANHPLTRYAWISIGAAITTILLKAIAYFLTGSVGMLSDALESFINLAAAAFALVVLRIANRPPDLDHQYGHEKVEYFSSGFEGALILIAAAGIVLTSIERLNHPEPVSQIALGIIVSGSASVVNLVVSLLLRRAGKRYGSIALEGGASHLMSDVWSSVAVIVGLIAVALTNITWIDPIMAIVIAVQIVFSGVKLVRRSILGLLDTALEPADRAKIEAVLNAYQAANESTTVQFHALRTRQSGMRRFVSFHVLVPGSWTVQAGHQLAEQLEIQIRQALHNTTVFTHVEPIEDPVSWEDQGLDRPVELASSV